MAVNGNDPSQYNYGTTGSQNQQQAQSAPQTSYTTASQSGTGATSGAAGSASGSSGTPASGSSSNSNTAAPTQPQNVANPQATSSGSFTNLKSYLNANQNYNNGQGLAGSIANNLNQQGAQVSSDYNTAFNQFQNQVGTGRNQYNAAVVQSATSDPYAYLQSGGQSFTAPTAQQSGLGTTSASSSSLGTNAVNNQVVAGATAPVNNHTDYETTSQLQSNSNWNKINQLLTGQYTGPTQLQNQTQLDAEAQNYLNEANMTQKDGTAVGSDAGRMQLISSLYNKPTYTQGQQSLDNLFVQADPRQMQTLQNLTNNTNQIQNQIGNINQQTAAKVQQYQTEAAVTQQKTKQALNDALAKLETDLTNKLNTDTGQQNYLKRAADGSYSLTTGSAAQYGLTPGALWNAQGTGPLNLDQSAYYNPTPLTLTSLSPVASQADLNKYAALAAMLGQNSPNVLNPQEVGTYQAKNPFNADAINSALAAGKQAYLGAVAPTVQDFTAQESGLQHGLNIMDTTTPVPGMPSLATYNATMNQDFTDPNKVATAMSLLQQMMRAESAYGIPLTPMHNTMADLSLQQFNDLNTILGKLQAYGGEQYLS